MIYLFNYISLYIDSNFVKLILLLSVLIKILQLLFETLFRGFFYFRDICLRYLNWDTVYIFYNTCIMILNMNSSSFSRTMEIYNLECIYGNNCAIIDSERNFLIKSLSGGHINKVVILYCLPMYLCIVRGVCPIFSLTRTIPYLSLALLVCYHWSSY